MRTLTVTRPDLARVLGVSERETKRLEARGVVVPVSEPKRGQPSLFDLSAAVPAFVAYRTAERAETPKDARDRAQADFVRLKIAQVQRDLVRAEDVQRDAAMIVTASRVRLERLAFDLARIAPEAADRASLAVSEALEELAALGELPR